MLPHLETPDVQLQQMAPAKVQSEPFHQHLVLGEDRVAGVTCFAVA